jgi:hypothetical protein
MRNLLEHGEQVTRPAAIGTNAKGAQPRRSDLEIVCKEKAIERAVAPKLFQKKVKRFPGIEESIATGSEERDGALEIVQLRHEEFVSQARAPGKELFALPVFIAFLLWF